MSLAVRNIPQGKASPVLRREGAWWLSRLWRMARTSPVRLSLLGLATVILHAAHLGGWFFGVAVVLAFLLWERYAPCSFQRIVAGPRWRRNNRRFLRRNWNSLMEGCGLARRVPAARLTWGKDGLTTETHTKVVGPVLRATKWRDMDLVATATLRLGQTPEALEAQSEQLRRAMSARRLRITPGTGLTCQLIWSYGDPLGFVPPREVPALSMSPSLDRVPMGRTEDGDTWMLPLRWHTLTAGASGAGKGSVLWSLMVSLAPQVHSGLVEVHGIDLKGGTELAMGRALFTRLATKPDEAVVLLEEAAVTCRARAERMAGNTRLHEPTTQEPLVIVLIDEMASLTAYLPDKKLIARAEDALSTLLSIGRAPGFYVYGFLQDPRKEVLKMRNLFLQSVGLRLNSREEVSMVLGDGALNAGARCHKIGKDMPGTGYVIEDGGRPVRVRASYVTDDVIRATAKAFPAPRTTPVVVPAEPEPTPRAPRASAPRNTTPRTSRRKPKDATPPEETNA